MVKVRVKVMIAPGVVAVWLTVLRRLRSACGWRVGVAVLVGVGMVVLVGVVVAEGVLVGVSVAVLVAVVIGVTVGVLVAGAVGVAVGGAVAVGVMVGVGVGASTLVVKAALVGFALLAVLKAVFSQSPDVSAVAVMLMVSLVCAAKFPRLQVTCPANRPQRVSCTLSN